MVCNTNFSGHVFIVYCAQLQFIYKLKIASVICKRKKYYLYSNQVINIILDNKGMSQVLQTQ